MIALVTGSNGFIGSWLVEALLRRGDEVRCLVRNTSNLRWLKGLNVDFVYGELSDKESLNLAVQDVDCIFHLAGVTKARDQEGYFKGNYQGTVNLLEASERRGQSDQKFVFVSSLAAAGPAPTATPLTESDSPHPISYYGEAKLAAEQAVLGLASQRPISILRPPPVYGPRDTDVYEMFRYINYGLKPVLGGGERLTSLVHVHDLVRGILLCADNEAANGNTYFICNNEQYSWRTINDEIQTVLEKRAMTIRVPPQLLGVVAFFSELSSRFSSKPPVLNNQKVLEMKHRYWICDNSKAKEELGFHPEISLSQGIRETANWYRSMDWL